MAKNEHSTILEHAQFIDNPLPEIIMEHISCKISWLEPVWWTSESINLCFIRVPFRVIRRGNGPESGDVSNPSNYTAGTGGTHFAIFAIQSKSTDAW